MLWILLGGFIVVIQTLCMMSVLSSPVTGPCGESSDCPWDGQWCTEGSTTFGTCAFCENMPALVGHSNATEFCTDQPAHPACRVCHNISVGDAWRPSLRGKHVESIIARTNLEDYISLAFASFLMAMEITNEIDDVMTCFMLMSHVRITLHARLTLSLLNTVRLYILLPLVLFSAPNLALWSGSNSLAIFGNSLAVLFMLEVDDAFVANFINRDTLEAASQQLPDVGSWMGGYKYERHLRCAQCIWWSACPLFYATLYLQLGPFDTAFVWWTCVSFSSCSLLVFFGHWKVGPPTILVASVIVLLLLSYNFGSCWLSHTCSG